MKAEQSRGEEGYLDESLQRRDGLGLNERAPESVLVKIN